MYRKRKGKQTFFVNKQDYSEFHRFRPRKGDFKQI